MQNVKKILVTGANGFIGTWLVKTLVERGLTVRALSRRGALENPPGVDLWNGPRPADRLEIVRGDITSSESMDTVVEGCSHVFHLAAVAKSWAREPATFRRVNVDGARNLLSAAKKHGVQRVVFTSTIVTLGPSRPGVVHDESTPRVKQAYFNEYEETKAAGEEIARTFANEGLSVVIVNPTRVFGPGHLNESNSVAILMRDYLLGRMPFVINGGVNVANYVLVHDAVQGHLLAMQRGTAGERYILGGENASVRQLVDILDQIVGKRHFRFRLPNWGAMAFAHLESLLARTVGIYPKVTPGWMRSFMVDWAYSCDKARDQLGYRPSSLEQGVRTTCQWLQSLSPVKEKSRPLSRGTTDPSLP